jgi:hypothetical protein
MSVLAACCIPRTASGSKARAIRVFALDARSSVRERDDPLRRVPDQREVPDISLGVKKYRSSRYAARQVAAPTMMGAVLPTATQSRRSRACS